MCLLVVVSRLDPDAPLVVGANRDERLDRPAVAMTVLQAHGPRIVGGRDERAGGTWLAVNEHGVVAGLTNRPSPDGPDTSKRTRGELPILLAQHAQAADAVQAFAETVRPREYNPAWLLVGDRTSLYAVDVTGDRPHVEALDPGVHVLENNPLGSPSAKVDHVLALLGELTDLRGDALVKRVGAVLGDHTVPPEVTMVGAGDSTGSSPGGSTGDGTSATNRKQRPLATYAACVHTEEYGTRSATLVRVPTDVDTPPTVQVADGHPCTSGFADATRLWASARL